MSILPLDFQRRCERRWAARFPRPVPPVTPNKQELEGQDQKRGAAAKSKRKTRRLGPTGLRSAPAV